LVELLFDLATEGALEFRQADLLARAGAGASTLHSLESRGIIEVVERETLRSPLSMTRSERAGSAPVYAMHEGQTHALGQIVDALKAEQFKAFLLHGVTGSGKTEVYIGALKHALGQGKTGIILVPEIALTPQTVRRFQAHFGDRIAVLHSRMSLGERYDTWRLLRSGRFAIAIGPRSAIFAPLENVGLIVVDEEHESSYKQFDPAPRYHARDVALVRAQMSGAVCVLGSATPSIESFANAHAGKYTLLRMPERVPVDGSRPAPLPPVRVVDLGLEKKKHQLEGAISTPLREAISARLARREQVILLQNRRGYAPVLECTSCGWSPICYDCSVTLTYHKAKRHLRCHYCGRTQRLPRACPKCGETELEMLGAGTQRVEEELATLFPAAAVLRMDLDTTSRKDAHHKLLSRFGRGEADILLGTQMVAKGLDFPRVTLVGVINADAGMLLPDFRSEERTFQLLTQVAGRAGRADLRGEVILQTRNPQSVVLRYACEHDYIGFVEAILPDRKTFGYPPFGRVVGIEFRGPEQEAVRNVARAWTDTLRGCGGGVQVLGPEPAFVGRVKRQYRYHTIIKVPRGGAAHEVQNLLRHTSRQFGSPPRGCRIAIDVDAVGLF
ncbi:MAG TPA: primosomal protein N', partial [Rhodothermales bacterium]|nr:primosomal protein N' [Rhodothermales bacterium]